MTNAKALVSLYIATNLRQEGIDWFKLEAQIKRLVTLALKDTKTVIVSQEKCR
jgi:predicted transcriptional regulator with HTH domain